MELFIVPTAEAAEAKQYAGDMKVVGVDNLDGALKALADNGGSVDSVQQAAAAHGGGTTVK
jgi:ABC-type sugar transport system substrate-binding protein